jgi:hypothetical protein
MIGSFQEETKKTIIKLSPSKIPWLNSEINLGLTPISQLIDDKGTVLMSLSVGRKNRPHVHLELGLKNEGGIWMGRETLDDFYRQDFKVGDIIGLFEGKVKVLDMNYQNEFGSFIYANTLRSKRVIMTR